MTFFFFIVHVASAYQTRPSTKRKFSILVVISVLVFPNEQAESYPSENKILCHFSFLRNLELLH